MIISCSGAAMWEVKGGNWMRLSPDSSCDSIVVEGRERGENTSSFSLLGPRVGVDIFHQLCQDLFFRLMLPEGYPDSRVAQGIANQISGILSTQVLCIVGCFFLIENYQVVVPSYLP
ncbi:hypothetical protein IEQ34_014574 [Dendrobium chrysotoxum]|uniref:Uncharacterized protein n=1 Tax=Dendrobium chrysotoxum TaxID=161865 RepID=A0AAV7GL35_DENCH|nr:hypothetical protein IEQ34_014574 [Dendrobium chrysotoxum]